MAGASAAKLAIRLRPLSFLMVSVYSKFDFGLPRSDGSFEVHGQLGRQLLGERDVDRQLSLVALPFRLDGQGLRVQRGVRRHVEAKLQRDAGVRRRHRRRDRLSAAQQRRGPAARHARDRELVSLRPEPVILQAQRDVRRGARPDRDRRIVGHQVKTLDVARRLRGMRIRGDQSDSESKGGEVKRSHREHSCNGRESRVAVPACPTETATAKLKSRD